VINLKTGTSWHTDEPAACSLNAATVVGDRIEAVETCPGSTAAMRAFSATATTEKDLGSFALPSACAVNDPSLYALAGEDEYGLISCKGLPLATFSADATSYRQLAIPQDDPVPGVSTNSCGDFDQNCLENAAWDGQNTLYVLTSSGDEPDDGPSAGPSTTRSATPSTAASSGAASSSVTAIDLQTGKEKWTKPFNGSVVECLLAAGKSGVLVGIQNQNSSAWTAETLAAADGTAGSPASLPDYIAIDIGVDNPTFPADGVIMLDNYQGSLETAQAGSSAAIVAFEVPASFWEG
jgi:hypothetical protein